METGMWLILKNLQEANEEVLNGLVKIAENGEYELSS